MRGPQKVTMHCIIKEGGQPNQWKREELNLVITNQTLKFCGLRVTIFSSSLSTITLPKSPTKSNSNSNMLIKIIITYYYHYFSVKVLWLNLDVKLWIGVKLNNLFDIICMSVKKTRTYILIRVLNWPSLPPNSTRFLTNSTLVEYNYDLLFNDFFKHPPTLKSYLNSK